MQSQLTHVRRFLSVFSVLLFLGLLSLPTVDKLFGFSPHASVAESDTNPLPGLTIDPASWDKWFGVLRHGYLDRHYNLRGLLISWNSYLDTFVLVSTTPSSKVMAGRDNWLFLAQDGPSRNVIEDARGLDGLPEASMAILANEIEQRRQWLAQRGIQYLVILAPNKNSVYPEMLPEAVRPLRAESLLMQLTNYLQAHTKAEIVNVTSGLLQEKKQHQVFYKSDSHWNAHGAFAAYTQIVDVLRKHFPAIVPLTRDQFRVESYAWLPGDLAYMLGLSDHLHEDRVLYFNKNWYAARGVSYDGPRNPHYFEMPQYSITGNPSLPTAVVFHDSFWWELLPFFAEAFNKALYVWLFPQTENELRFFNKAIIEKEQPDIVIEEFTERYILPPIRGRFDPKSDAGAAKPE